MTPPDPVRSGRRLSLGSGDLEGTPLPLLIV